MSGSDRVNTGKPLETASLERVSATRALTTDVLARIWRWLDLDQTRAPSAVCHEFLRSFTLVHHVSISEDDLIDLFDPHQLQLNRVLNYVSNRFQHIRTLRVYFSCVTTSYFCNDSLQHRAVDPDCLCQLLSNCAPEIEELVISFPGVATRSAERALLGPRKHCAFCRKERSKLLRCGRCKCVSYCSKRCQKNHWRAIHRQECAAMRISGQKEANNKKLLYDPTHTIGRHPLRQLSLSSFVIPPSVLERLLGKLVRLEGPCVHGYIN